MFRAATAMYKASADDRGTVQTLSRELDEAREDGAYHTESFPLH